MDNHNFLNISNILVLIIIWGSYLILIINYLCKPSCLSFIPQNIDYISLFAAYSAISGILYSNFKSDQRNEKSLINSNEQLIEQLTRDKKETAIFKLLKDILSILNDDMKQSKIRWIATGEHFVESFNESNPMEINLFVQNKLYYYFVKFVNSPELFNYLPLEIRNEIKRFNDEYYFIYSKFLKFVGLKYFNEFDDSKDYFDYTVIDKDSRPENYLDIGNYYINSVDRVFVDENYGESDYCTVIIKIDERKFDEFEAMINKIVYLAYIESLNYGYNNLGS